jgi:uncharacterized membrane protein YfcA
MMELWHFPLLFAAAFVAGFVDSIAGGGGLITVPLLLSVGLDPRDALGTNKLQASFGSASASWHYSRSLVVSVRECGVGFAMSFGAACLGAVIVRQLDPVFLRRAIPILLIAVAVNFLFKPDVGREDTRPRMTGVAFHMGFGALIGFYDGFFGPGTGTFWTMAYVMFLGFNLVKATGYTKVMNFASNIGSLLVFVLGGNVWYVAGLLMGVGQMLGARVGSRMVITRGAQFIRPIFITVVLAITLKLLWDTYRN